MYKVTRTFEARAALEGVEVERVLEEVQLLIDASLDIGNEEQEDLEGRNADRGLAALGQVTIDHLG